nr:O-antigen ligase family protein [Kiritimatiellia bacterium]
FRVVYGQGPISFDRIADTRVVERIAGANAVGFYCVLGIIGMLALMQEVKSLWLRGGLAAGGVIALYGVVLSASRGAFVALIATAVLWPVLCMVGGSKDKSKAVVGALVVLVLAYWMFQFVVESTYLGVRFTNATQLEDGSSQTRLELFLTGLRVFAQNPIFGTGLGQFGVVSRTGHYAHNEFAEIIATTGLPGFLMYFSIYLLVWRRLSGCLRRVADPLIAYRINMARLIVLILVLSGFLSRPNFIAQDTMFLLGLVVGVSHWAERTVRLAAGQGAAAAAPAWAATGWEAPGWGPPAPAGWGAGFSGSPMVPAASGLPAFNRRT